MGCCGSSGGVVHHPATVPSPDGAVTTMYRPKAHYVPSSWVFIDEFGNHFEDRDINVLVARIIQFRHENKYPDIAHLLAVVETFTLSSDDKYFPYREPYVLSAEVPLSVKTIMKGALGYLKGVIKGDDILVDQKTADARSLVCMNCPYNMVVVNGQTKESAGMAQSRFCSLRGARRVNAEGALHLCGKCSCLNSCKVWFKKDFIVDASTKEVIERLKGEVLGLNGNSMRCWITDPKVD